MSCYFHGNTGCDCAKKSDKVQSMNQSKDLQVHHTVDRPEPFTITRKKYEPTEEMSVVIASVNGLRVMWNGPHKCTVERKDADGEWRPIPGVQKIDIKFSVDEPLPIITIQEIALPPNSIQFPPGSIPDK